MLEVADLERARIAAEDRLRGMQEQIARAKHEMRERLGAGAMAAGGVKVNLSDVRLQAGASIHAVGAAQKMAVELAGCYQRVERARQDLIKAMTARKAVGVLRQRRLEEWKYEQARREQAFMDEIVSARTARQRVEAQSGRQEHRS